MTPEQTAKALSILYGGEDYQGHRFFAGAVAYIKNETGLRAGDATKMAQRLHIKPEEPNEVRSDS